MVATVVRVISGSTSNTTNHVMTLGAASNSANTILLYIQGAYSSPFTVTASDGFSQDYYAPQLGGVPISGKYFYRKNPGAALSTITFTTSATTYIEWFAIEVSGLSSAGIGSSVNVQMTDYATMHSVPFTTASDNAFVLAVGSYYNGGVPPPTLYPGFDLQASSVGALTAILTQNDAGVAGAKSLVVTSEVGRRTWGIVTYQLAATDPTVSTITSGSVTEGGSVVFTVTLSGATNLTTNYAASFSGTATSADYNNALGSATYSDDVMFSGGDFVVPSGVSRFTVTIATTQDALDEDNETLVLRVGGVDSTGGTITDDDAAPTISVNDATENAGEVIFTVSLSAASGRSITVDYATADGTSTAGVDYTAKTGTLTFAAGETTKTVTVTVP